MQLRHSSSFLVRSLFSCFCTFFFCKSQVFRARTEIELESRKLVKNHTSLGSGKAFRFISSIPHIILFSVRVHRYLPDLDKSPSQLLSFTPSASTAIFFPIFQQKKYTSVFISLADLVLCCLSHILLIIYNTSLQVLFKNSVDHHHVSLVFSITFFSNFASSLAFFPASPLVLRAPLL